MALRNPKYVDTELIQNLAEYHGIEYGVAADYVERTKVDKSKDGGVAFRGLRGGMSKAEGTEIESSYSLSASPIRIMNDVIDTCQDRELILPASDDLSGYRRNELVELPGSLHLHPAAEVGNVIGQFLPAYAASGGDDLDQNTQRALLSNLVSGRTDLTTQLFELESDDLPNVRIILPIDPAHFFRNKDFEDFETDVTVFATIERIVPEGQSTSLERWLLPKMDRTIRRLFKKKGLDEMLKGMQEALSLDIEDSKTLSGPALELRPIAIY